MRLFWEIFGEDEKIRNFLPIVQSKDVFDLLGIAKGELKGKSRFASRERCTILKAHNEARST